MDLRQITDINELKVLKSDQYDALELHNREAGTASQNIQMINARIAELEAEADKSQESESVGQKKR
jgi:hypothetical protein